MHTIEVNMVISKNGEAILQLPLDIIPGEYRAVIELQQRQQEVLMYLMPASIVKKEVA